MAQPLTNAQTELLNLFSSNLLEADLAKLKVLLADFVRQTAPAQVGEPAPTYTRLSASDALITLSIPKKWLDDAWLAKLLNWLELKRLTKRNQMTEADALEMGKQAKADWWEKNQQWVLGKIGESFAN